MAPGIPSPHIPTLQARDFSPRRHMLPVENESTVVTLTSLVLADQFEVCRVKENESPESAIQSPVKTAEILKENFKLLSEKLHEVRTDRPEYLLPASPHSLIEFAVPSSISGDGDWLISRLEKWSDDGNIGENLSSTILEAPTVHQLLTATTEDDAGEFALPSLSGSIETEKIFVSNNLKVSDAYSSDFPYLAPATPEAPEPEDPSTTYRKHSKDATSSPTSTGDHKLRKYFAQSLTRAITKDLHYLKDELQFLRFRYVDTEANENIQNMEIALREGNEVLLVDERKRFETAIQYLQEGIDSAIQRAEEIIVWRVEGEIEGLIKTLT